MNNYCMIQNSKTFAFSAENPTGVRAGGSQGGDYGFGNDTRQHGMDRTALR